MDQCDARIVQMSGPAPVFDPVLRDFLANCRDELLTRCLPSGLLDAANLGGEVPWLWRLAFRTRGLARSEGDGPRLVERHVVALRFLPDYLRRVDRFETLALVEPYDAFHPNLRPPGICLEIYPGAPLAEICESLHALLSWRLRQFSETDALNPEACVWGRSHLDELPLDTRPLFGRAIRLTLEPCEVAK
jgi:hypothetical protein